MKKIILSTIVMFSIILSSCSSDDNGGGPMPPEETTLTEVIAAITNNGNAKTWKIENATLTNSGVTDLAVTNAFNIAEDEFLFAASGNTITLEHKQRNDFNREASSFQEFFLDYYKSPLNYNLSASSEDATLFSDASGDLGFTYENENLITGEWVFNATSKLTFSLTVKTSDDYPEVPSVLNFQEVVTMPLSFRFLESLGSADILASQSNNSMYITYTTDAFTNPNGPPNRAEAIIKYDISTNTFSNNVFFNQDFFTKRAHITNNQLKIIGTQYINTYDLDFNTEPSSFGYNLLNGGDAYTYFRYDVVINNDDIYILGGSPSSIFDPNFPTDYFDKVLKYDDLTQQLAEVATLPASKSQAATEIVDGKIYVFSGQRGFSEPDTVEALSYIYDIETNTFSSFNLPQALNVSYAVAQENLIYVAGQVYILDPNDESIIDINAYLGVYNTEDGAFTEIQHNLDDSDTNSRISGISYSNNKLYVVYGDSSNSGETGDTKILAADL